MLRNIALNVFLVGATVVMGIACLPLMLGPQRWTHWSMRSWARILLWGCAKINNMKVVVAARPELPAGPVIIAPKHQSAMDIMLVLAHFNAPVFVLKQELIWLPVISWYALRVGSVWIDREQGKASLRKMLRAAKREIDAGRPILVFPEGTRTAYGTAPPLKPGVVGLYKQLGASIVPVALDSGAVWPRGSVRKTPGIVTIRVQPAIPPGLGKVELLDRLHAAINVPLNGEAHKDG